MTMHHHPPCKHLVVDDYDPLDEVFWRRCLVCGLNYNRTLFCKRLERAIRDRYRLPKSPWAADEATDFEDDD